jgi:hypothetical protein
MRRRVVNVLSLVSSVVCVLSLSVVGRSFFRADMVVVPMGQESAFLAHTFEGKVVLGNVDLRLDLEYISGTTAEVRPNYDLMWEQVTGIRWLGVGWGGSVGFINYMLLILPLWVVPIVTAIPPVWWWRVRRRAGGRGFDMTVGSRQSAVGRGDGGHGVT